MPTPSRPPSLDFLAAFLRAAGPGIRFAPPEAGGACWLSRLPVAGFRFHEGREVLDLLREGDALELRREPENPHDPRAVRILWLGVTLGYLPRNRNEAPADLLDRGVAVMARISAVDRDAEPWQAVRIEVLLEGRQLTLGGG